MASKLTRDAVGKRILSLCAADSDERSFRGGVIAELHRAVDFGAHVWLLTDPVTTVGSAPHADVPALRQLPFLIRCKYLTTVNRWSDLAVRGVPVASLLRETGGNPAESLVWREVLHRYAVTDVASVVLADRYGCWGFLDLWRGSTPAAFDDGELAFLAGLAPALTQALRLRQGRTFAAIPQAQRRDDGPVVLLLDENLQVLSQTAASAAWLATLLPSIHDLPPVPAIVYNAAAQLLAAEQHVDAHEARVRTHLAGGIWITGRAARLEAQIAVSLEASSPEERLELFALAHGMSGREAELLALLADGSDTKRIAGRMFLSELTVQDHLKSIFAKSGTHNRRSLVARIWGTRAG